MPPPTPTSPSPPTSKPSWISPTRFARFSDPSFRVPPHVALMEQATLRLLRTKGKAGLIVQLPVRHGKSEFFSRFLPAWYLMSFPERDVLLTGYGTAFAAEWGTKARDVFRLNAPPLMGVTLGPKARDEHWTTDRGGSLHCTGTGGSITGRGASLLLCDDLVRDQEAAESPRQRESVWRWFMADCWSRLEPEGKCVVVMSRRHPEDMVSSVLELAESSGTPWETIRLPALAEANDPLGRQPGEALWPDRYSAAQLEQIRTELELAGTSHLWSSLYQQDPQGDPSKAEWPASYFEGIYYDQLPPSLPVSCTILALDPSKGKDARGGDYSALIFAVLAQDGTLYVEDTMLRVMPTDMIETLTEAMVEAYHPDCLIIEANGFQELLADNIAKRVPHQLLFKMNNLREKHVRIRMGLSPLLAQKKLRLRKTPANALLLAQLRSFPNGTHDDGPDACELALQGAWQLLSPQLGRPGGGRPGMRLRV